MAIYRASGAVPSVFKLKAAFMGTKKGAPDCVPGAECICRVISSLEMVKEEYELIATNP